MVIVMLGGLVIGLVLSLFGFVLFDVIDGTVHIYPLNALAEFGICMAWVIVVFTISWIAKRGKK
jgi:hypothetical protein